jgi:predicted Rossmann fold nucleotide-binding protein DprA/Smf involved in DNA uptake
VIAFSGARKGLTAKQYHALRLLVEGKPAWVEVCHGDAFGADEMWHGIAHAAGRTVTIYPCTLTDQRAYCRAENIKEPAPPLERNRAMVDACRGLVACPSGEEHARSGTWATIRYARTQGRPIVVVWPDGTVALDVDPLRGQIEAVARQVDTLTDALRARVAADPTIRRLVAAVDGRVEGVEASRLNVTMADPRD